MRDSRHRGAAGGSAASHLENGEGSGEVAAAEKEGTGKQQQQEVAERRGHENMTRERTVTGPQGEVIHIKEAFDSNKNQWTVVSADVERIKAA